MELVTRRRTVGIIRFGGLRLRGGGRGPDEPRASGLSWARRLVLELGRGGTLRLVLPKRAELKRGRRELRDGPLEGDRLVLQAEKATLRLQVE